MPCISLTRDNHETMTTAVKKNTWKNGPEPVVSLSIVTVKWMGRTGVEDAELSQI